MHLGSYIGGQINNPIGGTAQSVKGHNLETTAGYDQVKNQMHRICWRNRAHHIGGKLWRYTFLPYYPGLVTCCEVHDQQVLTGWMSGCFLFRYHHNGKRYAAHVGTHETDEAKSDTAKRIWKNFADSPGVTDVWGFSPLDSLTDEVVASAYRSAMILKVAGLWEPSGIMRTAVFGSQGGNMARLTLLSVINPGLRKWSEIRGGPKFAGL